MEAHSDGPMHLCDQAEQQLRLQTDRTTAVRQAIHACRSGGVYRCRNEFCGCELTVTKAVWRSTVAPA